MFTVHSVASDQTAHVGPMQTSAVHLLLTLLVYPTGLLVACAYHAVLHEGVFVY